MAGMTSLVGAGIGLAGSLLSGSSQPKMQWKPMSTSNLWGGVTFDRKRKRMNQTLSAFGQELTGGLQDRALAAGTDPRIAQGLGIQQGAIGDMMGAYGGANAYGMMDPSIYGNVMGGLGDIAGGYSNLFGAAVQNPYALEQMGLGRDLLGSTPQSYQDVAASQLGLMREQAAPFEERALNALATSAFGRGRLGSTGGGRDLEAFSRGLSQADTTRQLQAQGFAEQLYGRDLQAALQRQGMGANLFSGGVGNYLQGLQQAGQYGQMGANVLGSLYDVGANYNQTGYNRATDRLARTGQLFGFGQALEGLPTEQQANFLNMLSGVTGEQANMARIGIAAAGPGAQTGGSPTGAALGGFLGGLGSGMLTGKVDFGSMFNTPSGTMNSQGIGLSQGMLDDAYGQINRLGG